MVSSEATRLVLVTGLSGSGKSTAAKCFEDLGYYVVDNLPLPLLEELMKAPRDLIGERRDVAVVTDLRAPGFAAALPELLDRIDRKALQPVLLFLESSNEVLVRRFSETRRPHPLATEEGPMAGVRRERQMLAEIRGRADMVFDTSEYSIHELRSKIYHAFSSKGTRTRGPGMVVSLESFGFKYGIPYGTDLLFDVRFLPNPHFVPELREKTGREAPVREFLEKQEDFRELRSRLADLLAYLLPRYEREHRSYLSVAVGCTGGKHRSVGLCEALGNELQKHGWEVRLEHRDISK